jgi:hypothetical protein
VVCASVNFDQIKTKTFNTMKKLFILIAITAVSFYSVAQADKADAKASCEKSSCGPEGTKKEEAAAITTLRSDLQTVITKMSKSSMVFDKQIADMTIAKGSSDDESLLYISQAVASVRFEFLNKIESSKLVSSLKEYKPSSFSTKQQMMSGLKKEVQILASQAEKL